MAKLRGSREVMSMTINTSIDMAIRYINEKEYEIAITVLNAIKKADILNINKGNEMTK